MRQETSKMPLSLISVDHLLLDNEPTHKSSCFHNETSSKKTISSFANNYQLEIVSGLEMGPYAHLSFWHWYSILCRPMQVLCLLLQSVFFFFRICLNPVDSEGLISLVSSIPSSFANISTSIYVGFPES